MTVWITRVFIDAIRSFVWLRLDRRRMRPYQYRFPGSFDSSRLLTLFGTSKFTAFSRNRVQIEYERGDHCGAILLGELNLCLRITFKISRQTVILSVPWVVHRGNRRKWDEIAWKCFIFFGEL